MKASAQAPANIGFIKYWGKRDEKLRLPCNSSISMTLSGCTTTTTVEFSSKFKKDTFKILGEKRVEKEQARVTGHLNRIRKKAGVNFKAKVISKNSFPKKAGIASSASGFAALTLAATRALDLNLSEKELSILARQGSGSASRSIPDGFVEWKVARKSKDSYAHSLYSEDYWNLKDLVVVVENPIKKIGSTLAMKLSLKNPYFKIRLRKLPERIKNLKKALARKDFNMLGEIIEEDSVEFHSIIMTAKPPIFYWNRVTMALIQKVHFWRSKGIPVYFTIDAGPNVHLICQKDIEKKLVREVKKVRGVKRVILNKPSKGARIITRDLF